MNADARIEVVRDLAEVPDWRQLQREYLVFACDRHAAATGQVADPEDLLRQTVAHMDQYLGPDGRFIAALGTGSGLVGMVLLHRLAGTTGEVKRLFIRPDVRGTGLGSRLLDRLEAEAREMGLTRLYLDTTIGLPDAIALYRARGFTDTTHDPLSLQDPSVVPYLMFMEKAL